MTKNNHGSTVFVVELCEPSSAGKGQVLDVEHRSRIALQQRILGFPTFVLDDISTGPDVLAKQTQEGRYGLHVRQVAERFGILDRQLFAGSHLPRIATKSQGSTIQQ